MFADLIIVNLFFIHTSDSSRPVLLYCTLLHLCLTLLAAFGFYSCIILSEEGLNGRCKSKLYSRYMASLLHVTAECLCVGLKSWQQEKNTMSARNIIFFYQSSLNGIQNLLWQSILITTMIRRMITIIKNIYIYIHANAHSSLQFTVASSFWPSAVCFFWAICLLFLIHKTRWS